MGLNKISTKELSKELEKREGITKVRVEPYEKIEIGGIIVDGPATIIINKNG
ncbi:BC1881 family protein [Bacillus sp. SN10]|uniref:BC1881 family protein n=1 Tax=Bacillus sp. SN10 TaxID=2056493 RepID=UPI0012FED96D|nr:BC1881 family protein [Bacillus sp. SN10]